MKFNLVKVNKWIIENQQEELRTDDVVEQIEEEVKESTESDEHVEITGKFRSSRRN